MTKASVPISFKASRRIDPIRVRKLFQCTGLNDWFSYADAVWYLRHALFVASAWAQHQCVGIAVLTGDGRISVGLDLLVVDQPYRGKGIGSHLMKLIGDRVAKLKPYHVSIEVFERRTERFYRGFGFDRNRGTWLLEHTATAQRLWRKAARCRQRLSEKRRRD